MSESTTDAGLRERIAKAIHRYDYDHGLSGNDIPSKHHWGEADAVLPVVAGVVTDRDRLTAEVESLRSWRRHWQYQTIGANMRIHEVLKRHEPVMDGAGLPSGTCTCGAPYPCPTKQAVGPRRPSWEETCDCAPDCPAQRGFDSHAGADASNDANDAEEA